jgi:rhamnose utilization protein RhaD (predicted bifunctional aldolase and dehydrogenase)
LKLFLSGERFLVALAKHTIARRDGKFISREGREVREENKAEIFPVLRVSLRPSRDLFKTGLP